MTEHLDATGKRIVAGADGSRHSRLALRWAASLAAAFGAQLEIVTTWEHPATYQRAAMASNWNQSRANTQMIDETTSTVFGNQPGWADT